MLRKTRVKSRMEMTRRTRVDDMNKADMGVTMAVTLNGMPAAGGSSEGGIILPVFVLTIDMLSVRMVPMTMTIYHATAIARFFRFRASCFPRTMINTANKNENHAKFSNTAPISRPTFTRAKINAPFGATTYIIESKIAANPQEQNARK